MNRRYGNAQTIGRNVNQNTYFITKEIGECFLAVLADGTIDSVTGAYGAILACEAIAKGFVPAQNIAAQLETQFARAAAQLAERLYKGRTPRVSVLAACFLKDTIIYKNVGELSLVSYDGKGLSVIQPEAGQIEQKGGAVLLCNPGIRQALTEVDIEMLLSGAGHPYKKAQNMVEAINRRNLKDQRSAVAVIVT